MFFLIYLAIAIVMYALLYRNVWKLHMYDNVENYPDLNFEKNCTYILFSLLWPLFLFVISCKNK